MGVTYCEGAMSKQGLLETRISILDLLNLTGPHTIKWSLGMPLEAQSSEL